MRKRPKTISHCVLFLFYFLSNGARGDFKGYVDLILSKQEAFAHSQVKLVLTVGWILWRLSYVTNSVYFLYGQDPKSCS